MMLFSDGAPLTPVGGSSWSLGKTKKETETLEWRKRGETRRHTQQKSLNQWKGRQGHEVKEQKQEGGDKGEKNMKKNDGKKKNPLDVKGEKQVGKTAEEGWWF